MLSPTGGILTQARQELQVELEKAKREIEAKVGSVITDMLGKLSSIEDNMRKLETKGEGLHEVMEKKQAETVTQLSSIIGEATSEFTKHRGVIDGIANEVLTTKKDIAVLTSGLREELDAIRAKLLTLGSATDSVGSANAVSSELRSELDGITAELVKLRAAVASGGTAAASHGGGGKLGGFISWKYDSQTVRQ